MSAVKGVRCAISDSFEESALINLRTIHFKKTQNESQPAMSLSRRHCAHTFPQSQFFLGCFVNLLDGCPKLSRV